MERRIKILIKHLKIFYKQQNKHPLPPVDLTSFSNVGFLSQSIFGFSLDNDFFMRV